MLIFFLVALGASVVGAVCGIGGGVIIKPVLDLLHLETVAAISFLSGCTVLSPILRRPRASAVALCLAMRPLRLLTSLMFRLALFDPP